MIDFFFLFFSEALCNLSEDMQKHIICFYTNRHTYKKKNNNIVLCSDFYWHTYFCQICGYSTSLCCPFWLNATRVSHRNATFQCTQNSFESDFKWEQYLSFSSKTKSASNQSTQITDTVTEKSPNCVYFHNFKNTGLDCELVNYIQNHCCMEAEITVSYTTSLLKM